MMHSGPSTLFSMIDLPGFNDMFIDNGVCVVLGDELGRVTLKDFQGTEPGQTQSTHSRRVSGLAFSSHR